MRNYKQYIFLITIAICLSLLTKNILDPTVRKVAIHKSDREPWLARTLRMISLGSSSSLDRTRQHDTSRNPDELRMLKKCSIDNFLGTNLEFINSTQPISTEDFVERRDQLASVLAEEQIDAFIAEPGYSFQYYANISQHDWEPWEPEERPFLMIVKPRAHLPGGKKTADTWFLAPEFEAGRVRLLDMPFQEPLKIIKWKEHWNPYVSLLNSSAFPNSKHGTNFKPKIMVDEEMRDFIQRGLGEHGFEVVGLSEKVERIRQTKSSREVEILRTVNTATVEAVRQMRKCLHPGLSEDEVRNALDATLEAGGLKPFFNIVLFDDDASNPHGGTGGKKRLSKETLVLIDVGAHLHGYSSDITRTFFPPYVPEYRVLNDEMRRRAPSTIPEKVHVWTVVFEAQSESISTMQENATAADVDIAARTVINNAGYKGTFTHRLGHGIGIKAHESPYLNKGNSNTTLRAGMTFTSEPGIYLVDKFGVRHEDVLLVNPNGVPEVLSGKRATSPWEP